MVRTTPEGWRVHLTGSKGGLHWKQLRAAPEQGAAMCRRWKGQGKRPESTATRPALGGQEGSEEHRSGGLMLHGDCRAFLAQIGPKSAQW
jgi:hypothetical protein